MKKNSIDKLFDIEDVYEVNDDYFEKKIKLLKILPWISISFNIFIQFLMFIFIIILKNRISIKSDFGFPQIDNNQSIQKNILGNSNSGVISNENRHQSKKKSSKKYKEEHTDNLNSAKIKIVKKRHKKRGSKNKKH